MQLYAESLTEYKRLATFEVKVGDLLLGNFNPIRIQTCLLYTSPSPRD